MSKYVKVAKIQVAEKLYNFVNEEALPGTGLEQESFWSGFAAIVQDLTPRNRELLEIRAEMQKKIDEWHKQNKDEYDFVKYKKFLTEIGYIEPGCADFQVQTDNVDLELKVQAGPQLVVPILNARYTLNAVNARWGSLYDALYGTDVIASDAGAENKKEYNPVRGDKVIKYAKDLLDQAVPLVMGSHSDSASYSIENNKLQIQLKNGNKTELKNSVQFIGYRGELAEPTALLFVSNGLHIEMQFDKSHPIGKTDATGLKDVLLESAISTILDFEDSVTAVDTEDKIAIYRNWLGLMQGTLRTSFTKAGKTVERKLNPDRKYIAYSDGEVTLPARSLMFVRNVGHLMTNDMVLDETGKEMPEGIIDGIITVLVGMHDLQNEASSLRNSRAGSIYIVKPKMHGSQEVAFANQLFIRIEQLLGIAENTVKLGVMDEERRTSLNLKNCIEKVKNRIVFINTGFLDRTGDEIHTSIEAGAMIRKDEMKNSKWLQAYENNNVDVGLAVGMLGRAQIGKGMWAKPARMAEMMEQKVGHVKSGANTAWVPSPTAATLHAIHYHQVNVHEVQKQVMQRKPANIDDILQFPVMADTNWSAADIQAELENNAQGILGYVVRWVEQGIGCSTVPDINNIGLMEDRATLRISSQHMANWLCHGICTEAQVLETLKKMAKVVDAQNATDSMYKPMAKDFDNSVAFQAACDLVLLGRQQPSGYTEPILHRRRIEAKNKY